MNSKRRLYINNNYMQMCFKKSLIFDLKNAPTGPVKRSNIDNLNELHVRQDIMHLSMLSPGPWVGTRPIFDAL